MVAFIYFIHNISQSIQISNILEKIFTDAKTRLQKLIESEKGHLHTFPQTQEWHEYKTGSIGYFQNIAIENILNICEQENTKIHIVLPKGFFLLSNAVFFKSEKKLNDEVVEDIISNINFSRGELVQDNYLLGFKQITEVAVKAMSPGINDPGTAINAIDYLTELFAIRMQKRDNGIIMQGEIARLQLSIISFETLLYHAMASLRTYCKHDPLMVEKLLWMLHYLKQQPAADESYIEMINNEIHTLVEQAKISFDSDTDIRMLDKIIQDYKK